MRRPLAALFLVVMGSVTFADPRDPAIVASTVGEPAQAAPVLRGPTHLLPAPTVATLPPPVVVTGDPVIAAPVPTPLPIDPNGRFLIAPGPLPLDIYSPGAPHFGWPSQAPQDVVIHRDFRATRGNGVLPDARIHGPSGPIHFPHVDERAHRSVGVDTMRFGRPTWNGKRLDWCSEQQTGCGPIAAQAFCSSKGFHRVVQAVQERDVGLYAETSQIGSGLSCRGPGCHGFSRIVCTRE